MSNKRLGVGKIDLHVVFNSWRSRRLLRKRTKAAILNQSLRRGQRMNETELLKRITVNPGIFGGKPIVRGRRLAVEHVLGMLAAGDSADDLLRAYPWLEREDVLACLAYARRIVGRERVEPFAVDEAV